MQARLAHVDPPAPCLDFSTPKARVVPALLQQAAVECGLALGIRDNPLHQFTPPPLAATCTPTYAASSLPSGSNALLCTLSTDAPWPVAGREMSWCCSTHCCSGAWPGPSPSPRVAGFKGCAAGPPSLRGSCTHASTLFMNPQHMSNGTAGAWYLTVNLAFYASCPWLNFVMQPTMQAENQHMLPRIVRQLSVTWLAPLPKQCTT